MGERPRPISFHPKQFSPDGPRLDSGEKRTGGLDAGGNPASLNPAWMAGNILLSLRSQKTGTLSKPVVVLLSIEIQLLLGLNLYNAEILTDLGSPLLKKRTIVIKTPNIRLVFQTEDYPIFVLH